MPETNDTQGVQASTEITPADDDRQSDERRERDRRTMEAIERLYRRHDAEPSPPLFDEELAETYQPDRMARYVELMGRPPLHADEDRETLRQKLRRRGR